MPIATSSERLYGRRQILAFGAAGLLMLAVGRLAYAQNLDSARSSGLVGERRNGLLGVVSSGPGIQALVDRINAERMIRYREVAASTGAPLDVVQARAGEQLIERAQPGWFVEAPGGGWTRK